MLVKEFIVNVSPEVRQRRHADFHKVFARGQCIQFSPAEINKFLGRSGEDEEEEVSLNQVVKEITSNLVKKWPSNGKPSPSLLSVKYVILYRIFFANWAPSNLTSTVSASLARIIYAV